MQVGFIEENAEMNRKAKSAEALLAGPGSIRSYTA